MKHRLRYYACGCRRKEESTFICTVWVLGRGRCEETGRLSSQRHHFPPPYYHGVPRAKQASHGYQIYMQVFGVARPEFEPTANRSRNRIAYSTTTLSRRVIWRNASCNERRKFVLFSYRYFVIPGASVHPFGEESKRWWKNAFNCIAVALTSAM